MNKLLELKADILCEGHFGIYKPKERVERYIKGYLGQHLSDFPKSCFKSGPFKSSILQ